MTIFSDYEMAGGLVEHFIPSILEVDIRDISDGIKNDCVADLLMDYLEKRILELLWF